MTSAETIAALDVLTAGLKSGSPITIDAASDTLLCPRGYGWVIHRKAKRSDGRVCLRLDGTWTRGGSESKRGRARVIFPGPLEAIDAYLRAAKATP